ncbi:MAG: hypothetical protein ACI4JI_00820 [Ruminiclostridium sp.]
MQSRADKKLLLYLLALTAFVVLSAVIALILVARPYAVWFICIGVGVYLLFCAYCVLYWNKSEYLLDKRLLTVHSGVFIKKKAYLYLDKSTAVFRFELPFSACFSVVFVQGGGAVILSGIEIPSN